MTRHPWLPRWLPALPALAEVLLAAARCRWLRPIVDKSFREW